MTTERAEAGTRIRMTEEDRSQFKGLARHPLARQWMLKRLIEARENMVLAEDKSAEQRWSAEVDRVAGELRRCGVKLGSGQ
tara:strand:- start:5505 stop:5747 length:243 start_codon:yes stop_codon:yes gene_type:complete